MTTEVSLDNALETLEAIQSWLVSHARDPHAGLMLLDFINGDCSHDFEDNGGLCELCAADVAVTVATLEPGADSGNASKGDGTE